MTQSKKPPFHNINRMRGKEWVCHLDHFNVFFYTSDHNFNQPKQTQNIDIQIIWLPVSWFPFSYSPILFSMASYILNKKTET
jgi:hypothetical protein